ncbi:hypothetical protein D3C79_693750 [compost metagenome]
MLWTVDLQPCNHAITDAGIVIDECHWAHGSVRAQGGDQLVAGTASAIDGNPGQAVVTAGEGYVLHGGCKPVAEEVLAHGQAQPADHDQAQPPVVEGD